MINFVLSLNIENQKTLSVKARCHLHYEQYMRSVVSDLRGKAQDRFFCILLMNNKLFHLDRLLLDALHISKLLLCF